VQTHEKQVRAFVVVKWSHTSSFQRFFGRPSWWPDLTWSYRWKIGRLNKKNR